MFYTIIVPTLEMRQFPQSGSEVVSQALFSEEIKVLEEEGEWVKIKTAVDDYDGWVKREGICSRTSPYTANDKQKLLMVNRLSAHLYDHPDTIYGPVLTLPFESRLLCPNFIEDDSRWLSVELPDAHTLYIQRGDIAIDVPKLNINEISAFSQLFLGLPYTWGGRSSFGYDCSGFVQMLYRQMGIFLPRDAKDQFVFSGFNDSPVTALELGDLVFFGFSKDQIKHVGLSLDEGRFIHTSSVTENKPYLRISHINDPAWNSTGYYPFLAARKVKKLRSRYS